MLRTTTGIPKTLDDDSGKLGQLIDQGWLNQSDTHYQLTQSGKALADPIAEALIL